MVRRRGGAWSGPIRPLDTDASSVPSSDAETYSPVHVGSSAWTGPIRPLPRGQGQREASRSPPRRLPPRPSYIAEFLVTGYPASASRAPVLPPECRSYRFLPTVDGAQTWLLVAPRSPQVASLLVARGRLAIGGVAYVLVPLWLPPP